MLELCKTFIESGLAYAAAAAVCAWSLNGQFRIPETFLAAFIGTAATMAAVFMGFMATSMSILILFRGTSVSEKLRKCGSMGTLVRYLREAMVWTLAWLISCFLLYFQQTSILLSAWLTLATLSLLCFVRVAFLMSRLIKD